MAFSWVKEYQPQAIDEIVGQEKAIEILSKFFDSFPTKKKAAFLHGPPGCGKTAMAQIFAKSRSWEIVEVNASDVRNKAQLEEKLAPAMQQQSLLFQGKIILIDEVDGLSGTKDRGGVPTLARLIDKTPFPVILTANYPWNRKFSALRKKAVMVEFSQLNYEEVMQVLQKVCKKECVDYQEDALKRLARQSGGDMRGALNDLQTLAQEDKKLTNEEVDMLGYRDTKEDLQNALTKVFKSKSVEITKDAWNDVTEDINTVFLWVEENLPKEYTKGIDRANAFDMLSRADVFNGRIRRRQHWRFLVYVYALLGAGIAMSKEEKYPGIREYNETKRLLKIWMAKQKYGKRKAIAEKYAEHSHTSTSRALQTSIPFLKVLFENGTPKMAATLDLDEEEINWLKK